jgi:hypothetical protein
MDCPLLSSSRLKPCKSTSDLVAHASFSSDKYCKDPWFTLCPRFRQQQFPVILSADAAASITRRDLTPRG